MTHVDSTTSQILKEIEYRENNLATLLPKAIERRLPNSIAYLERVKEKVVGLTNELVARL